MHRGSSEFVQGMLYLYKGCCDLAKPKLRLYLIIPLFLNVIVFSTLFYYGFTKLTDWLPFDLFSFTLPNWLSWLSGILSALKWFILTIAFTTLFSIIALLSTLFANLIGAPFNGFLSEHLSIMLKRHPENSLTIHSIFRELRKLLYYLPRALLLGFFLIILYFLPFANLAIPFVLFLFGAWMMAIQYIDYPADNFNHPFDALLSRCRRKRSLSLGFGLAAILASSIPLLNFCVMPAAVLGGTRLWHENLEEIT